MSSIRQFILRPAIPACLLAALAYAPAESVEWLLKLPFLSSLGLDTIKYLVRIFVALGFARSVNAALNSWAENNWMVSANPSWGWDTEIAVVTGGSGDIGKVIALGLARRGVKVAILDVREPDKELKLEPHITFFKCDVTSAASVSETAEVVRMRLGNPTILVNNAGVTDMHAILDTSEAFLHKIFGVNIMSHWYTTKEFLPYMLSRNRGHIITMASLASYIALPTGVDYSATKAGALAFHEGLTAEIKRVYKTPGVVTTVVLPSFVRTGLTERFADRIERRGMRMLRVEAVSEPVLEQIFSGRGGHLIVPSRAWFLSGFRGWPSWMQEFGRDLLGST